MEDQAEIGLRLGRHTDLVPRLSALFAAHPDRERLAGLLMLALYRSGRQTKALEVYRRIRARLAIDHGVEPGTTLRVLHAAILRCDPAISIPATDALVRDQLDAAAAGYQQALRLCEQIGRPNGQAAR